MSALQLLLTHPSRLVAARERLSWSPPPAERQLATALLTVSGAGVASVVIVAVLTASGSAHDVAGRAAVHLLVVAAPVATGVYAIRHGRSERFGRLLVAAGLLWSLAVLSESSSSVVYSTGRVATWLIFPVLIYLMLTFPDGRLGLRRDRWLFGAIAAVVLVLYLGSALVVQAYPLPNPWTACRAACPRNAFFVLSSEPRFLGEVVVPLRDGLSVLLLVGVLGSLTARLRTSSATRQVTVAPVLAVSVVATVVLVAFIVVRRVAPASALGRDLGVVWTLCLPAIAAAFSLGLLQRRLLVTNVLSRLSGTLSEPLEPPQIGVALRESVGDPAVEVLVRDRDGRRWVRGDGSLAAPAGLPGAGRVMRELGDGSEALAAVVMDEGTTVDDDLLQAILGLGEAALREARLKADLEASLHDLDTSRKRIATAADAERRRIERDLHDGAQQRLIALRMRLSLAEDLLRDDPAAAGDAIRDLGGDVDLALEDIRSLAHGIYPALLADRGVADALRSAARRSSLRVDVRAAGLTRHTPEVESAVYFSCLEALQNATKHAAGARRVQIALRQDDALDFRVIDDGAGFDPAAGSEGAGLRNIRDRVESVGGRLELASSPGRGTVVHGVVPLDDGRRGVSAAAAHSAA